jgi:integrase
MPKVLLTAGQAGSIHTKAPQSGMLELYDTKAPGFGLRIGKKASTYFVVFRVRGEGKQLRRRLGTTKDTDLSDARAAATRILLDAKEGKHPDQSKREAEAADVKAAEATAKAEASTFLTVAQKYLSDKLEGGGAALRSRSELERKLNVDLAAWHGRPISQITKAEIRALVRAKAQTHGVAANRLLSFIKRVFAWASAQDVIESDPSAGIKKPGVEAGRERFLDDNEIRLFWRGCDRLSDPAGRLFKLALVTGQRRGEVAGLRRSELGTLEYRVKDPATGRDNVVAGDAWLLPAERTKRGKPHTVPLSTLARTLIDEAPVLKDEDGQPLDWDHVLASGLAGDQPVSGWSTFKERLDAHIGRVIAEEAKEPYDPQRHALPDWHIHDLRATCATHLEMEPLATPKAVISRILNHSEGDEPGSTSKYLRHKWDREAADALQLWADKIMRITGQNVVPLGERRGA